MPFPQPSQCFSTHAIQSKLRNTRPRFLSCSVKLSQVGSGTIKMFKLKQKLLQVPNETKTFKEGEAKHIGRRRSTNFQPFWENEDNVTVPRFCHFCAFFIGRNDLSR